MIRSIFFILLFAACWIGCQDADNAASANADTEQHDHDHDGHDHDHDGHDHDHDHDGHDHGDHDHGEAQAHLVHDDGIHFGEKITQKGAISFDKLLTKLEKEDEVEAKVIGTVESVCQAKGCWMNIQNPDNADAPPMFVKFKDYAFFVPKDISGRKVVMEGKAYWEVTPVDELRHYAEDEGASEEEIAAITEPKEELKFMASGVKLL